MPQETSRPVSVSTGSSLNKACDLVCAPTGGVGAGGARQLLCDEWE